MRHLTPAEISRLEHNGCRCHDWNRVMLRADRFEPDDYADTLFSGDNILGNHDAQTDGMMCPRIYRAHLHDCRLGDNVTVRDVHLLAGYTVGDGAEITGCGTIDGTGWKAGATTVNVLDETGSKSLRIAPGITAQIAGLAVHDESLRTLINNLPPEETTSARPLIGYGARLKGAIQIIRSEIGDGAEIGAGTMVEDCVIEGNALIDKGTQITRCFAGQNVILCNFTAQHSLFFANSHLCNGEAASVFAGPFTVSEHKSTLLIGGEFMMFNAGSGTNQSNHLYKLGPIHYGTMGRGCKCASDSYIMWPARIGDFTMVSGRHYSHPDTRQFPFSYLIAGNDGLSRLLPGENLVKCGTARDIAKWPARDRRPADRRLDIIGFDALNPATVSRMQSAVNLMDSLERTAENADSDFIHEGTAISRRAMAKGRRLYANAMMRYFGEKQLIAQEEGNASGVKKHNLTDSWTDMAGYVMPKEVIDSIIAGLQSGAIRSLSDLARTLAASLPRVAEMEREFALGQPLPEICSELYGLPSEGYTPSELLDAYIRAEEEYLTLVLADASKEAEMAGRPALADNDPTLDALKKRLSEIKMRAVVLSDRK